MEGGSRTRKGKKQFCVSLFFVSLGFSLSAHGQNFHAQSDAMLASIFRKRVNLIYGDAVGPSCGEVTCYASAAEPVAKLLAISTANLHGTSIKAIVGLGNQKQLLTLKAAIDYFLTACFVLVLVRDSVDLTVKYPITGVALAGDAALPHDEQHNQHNRNENEPSHFFLSA